MTEKNVQIIDEDGNTGWCMPSAFDAVWKARGWRLDSEARASSKSEHPASKKASGDDNPVVIKSRKPSGDWTGGENGSEGSTPETETKEGSK